MPVTMEQVLSFLYPDEPDYSRFQTLGRGALPFLEQLVQGADPMLASKAASAAGVIGSAEAVAVLEKAARSSAASVRVSAAAALGQLPSDLGIHPLIELLNDSDKGVRRLALRSASGKRDKLLRSRVKQIGISDPDARLRSEAREILKDTPQ
jgi:hypothetical protein